MRKSITSLSQYPGPTLTSTRRLHTLNRGDRPVITPCCFGFAVFSRSVGAPPGCASPARTHFSFAPPFPPLSCFSPSHLVPPPPSSRPYSPTRQDSLRRSSFPSDPRALSAHARSIETLSPDNLAPRVSREQREKGKEEISATTDLDFPTIPNVFDLTTFLHTDARIIHSVTDV